MRPRERRESGKQDLFRSRLDQIIDMDHALVKLARAIDWRFLEEKFGAVYTDEPGQPPLPTRLMAGLAILKHTYNLSDEALCERWVENPYFQYFCGEEFFQHALPFDRSSLTRWRQRMGEEKLQALLQESLAVATRTGRDEAVGLSPVSCRHHGAAEGGDVPDRRQAAEPGARAAGAAGQEARREPAPILSAGRQAGTDQAPALRPCPSVQTRQPELAQAQDLSRPRHPRHRAARSRATTVCRRRSPAAASGPARAGTGAPPARPQGLSPARARGRVHRQGQGAPALRVRRQSERRHHSEAFRKGGQFVAHAAGAARQSL